MKTENQIMDDAAEGAGVANYPGDQTEAIGQLMGPTNDGRFVRVAGGSYDPETNRTKLIFEEVQR